MVPVKILALIFTITFHNLWAVFAEAAQILMITWYHIEKKNSLEWYSWSSKRLHGITRPLCLGRLGRVKHVCVNTLFGRYGVHVKHSMLYESRLLCFDELVIYIYICIYIINRDIQSGTVTTRADMTWHCKHHCITCDFYFAKLINHTSTPLSLAWFKIMAWVNNYIHSYVGCNCSSMPEL